MLVVPRDPVGFVSGELLALAGEPVEVVAVVAATPGEPARAQLLFGGGETASGAFEVDRVVDGRVGGRSQTASHQGAGRDLDAG